MKNQTTKKNKRIIVWKAWTLISKDGELLGTGQGSFEYWYTKYKADQACKGYNSFHPKIKLNWKVVPIQITIKKHETLKRFTCRRL